MISSDLPGSVQPKGAPTHLPSSASAKAAPPQDHRLVAARIAPPTEAKQEPSGEHLIDEIDALVAELEARMPAVKTDEQLAREAIAAIRERPSTDRRQIQHDIDHLLLLRQLLADNPPTTKGETP